ncbi:hypothetical protein WMO79_19820 [Micrococcaceae bacterium Sec7.4]
MNSQFPSKKAADGRRRAHLSHRIALWLCLFIALFPPLHLAMVNGSLGSAMTYMAGGPAVMVLVIYLLRRSDDQRSRQEQEAL